MGHEHVRMVDAALHSGRHEKTGECMIVGSHSHALDRRFSHARVRSTYVGVIESSVIEKELSPCASKASCNLVCEAFIERPPSCARLTVWRGIMRSGPHAGTASDRW